MSWDTTSCFKAVCNAFRDFQRQPSDSKLVEDLQRTIDVVLGLASHGAVLNDFTPKELVYAETLSALVSIINDPNLKASLYLKSLLTLVQLADDFETKLSLQNDFNLGSSVVGFILQHISNTSNKQMVFQALALLEKMTYGGKCNINNIYMADLLKHVITSIYTTAHEYCIPSLAVLANLCRYNKDVKSYIKTMADAKKFGKTLLGYLSNSNKTFSITSLSILTSLYLNDSLGENMFSGQNLMKMIRLVFNVLIGNDDIATRHYSIDLVIDFIRCKKTLDIITASSKLETDVSQILNLLHTTDARTAYKVFELLIEYCKHPVLITYVIKVFVKNISDGETQIQDDVVLSPAQSLLHWISRSEREDVLVQVNILSLVFLKDMLNVIIDDDSIKYKITDISVYVHQILSVLLSHLTIDIHMLDDVKKMKQKFRKLSCVYEVVTTLCKDDALKDLFVSQIDFEKIFNVLINILDNFYDDFCAMRDPAVTCREEIISVVFRGLELIATVKHKLDNGLLKYSSLVQNSKLIPFLSLGLASPSKFLVHASIQIITEGMKSSGFQSRMLGDTLTLHNTSRCDASPNPNRMNHISQQHESKGSMPVNRTLREITNENSAQAPVSVNSLADRLSKGFDIKDAKMSDIMGFYEQKLSAVIGREKHIQDLLETKSVTLSQTERLLAEFRCRHAQSEAESLKICSLLQETERKAEKDALMINELKKNKEKIEGEIKDYQGKMKHLESVANKHEVLQNAFHEQVAKLNSTEKLLDDANNKIASLETSKLELIQQGEILRTELANLNEQLVIMSESKNELASKLKDKDKECKKFEKLLRESKEKVSSLEDHTQALEQSIGEKENKISQLTVEIEKQSQISAMIHNLTLGRKEGVGTTSATNLSR